MKHILLFYALLFMVFTSCSTARQQKVGGEFRVLPFADLGIAKANLPSQGQCKIWLPGKGAAEQSPPQSCPSAMASAPLGAWVITHEGSRYRLSILNAEKRAIIDEVRYYSLENE